MNGNNVRLVCLLIAVSGMTMTAQDGGAIYKNRCAACHESAGERVPRLAAIKAMSAEAIYKTLTDGPMKTQAAGLSTAEIMALISYIGPTGSTQKAPPVAASTCRSEAPFRFDPAGPQWNGWSPALTNSRFQASAAAARDENDVPKLKLNWAFNLGAVTEARSQPVAGGGRLFIGTATGTMYALDEHSGCTFWVFQAKRGIRGGASLGMSHGKPAVFFSEGGGTVYALDAQTGSLIWADRPVDHFASIATATPRYYQGVVYQSYSSFEEALGADPKFGCCTFRGSVVALSAETGEKLWQTFTIAEPAKPTAKSAAGTQQFGPSGAGIWATPTIDEQLHVLYVATGDNYSAPATDTSDAVLALDMKSGNIKWSVQLTAKDAFNNACSIPIPGNCPAEHGSDSDFGQPPILVHLASGKRALVIAQKSGMVHALDPDRHGTILWQTRVGEGGALGGSQWGSAADESNIYVAISDVRLSGVQDSKAPRGFRLVLNPTKGGGLHALDLNSGRVVWNAAAIPCAATRTDCSPAQSAAVTAIPHVVFSGSMDGHLRAYSSANGKVLWDFDTAHDFDAVNGGKAHGGSIDVAGTAIVNGMVFVNSGYGQWGGMPGNVLLALSPQ